MGRPQNWGRGCAPVASRAEAYDCARAQGAALLLCANNHGHKPVSR